LAASALAVTKATAAKKAKAKRIVVVGSLQAKRQAEDNLLVSGLSSQLMNEPPEVKL
jgi:hypothetical protein